MKLRNWEGTALQGPGVRSPSLLSSACVAQVTRHQQQPQLGTQLANLGAAIELWAAADGQLWGGRSWGTGWHWGPHSSELLSDGPLKKGRPGAGQSWVW